MHTQIILNLLALSFSSLATVKTTVFISTGEKVYLKGDGPFHFSSKEDVKVFSNSTPPFFTTLKPGLVKYSDHSKDYKVFSLTEAQYRFYNKTKPISDIIPSFKWSLSNGSLILSSQNLNPTVRDFLVKRCLAIGSGQVSLNFNDKEVDSTTPQVCREKLRPKSERNISVVILNSNKNKNSNYGLGIPGSVQWRLEAGDRLKLADQTGGTNLDKGKLNSKGKDVFVSYISIGNPVVFETGSEVGIQPQGLFNRRAVEWKKATTQIDIKMIEASNDEVKVKISLNKRSRTAQSAIFDLESFRKVAFLETGKWQKVLSYKDNSTSKIKNGIFGIGVSGSANTSKSTGTKEVWVQVRHAY